MIEYLITLQKRYVSWYFFSVSRCVCWWLSRWAHDFIMTLLTIASKWHRFDVMMTLMLCRVFAGVSRYMVYRCKYDPVLWCMHASLAWGWLNLLIISNANSNCFRRWAPVQILLISLLSVHFYGIFTPQPRWPDGWCRWLRPSVRPSAGQLMARAWPQWPWAALTSARCH